MKQRTTGHGGLPSQFALEFACDQVALLDFFARCLTRVLGDGCVIRLLSDDGWLTPVAIDLPLETVAREPETAERLRAHVARSHHLDEQPAVRQMVEATGALLVPRLDLAQLQRGATSEIEWAYTTIGIHSALLVTLASEGEPLGLVSLVRFEPRSGAFSERDQGLLQGVAASISLALMHLRRLRRILDDAAPSTAGKQPHDDPCQLRTRISKLATTIAGHLDEAITALERGVSRTRDGKLNGALHAEADELRRIYRLLANGI